MRATISAKFLLAPTLGKRDVVAPPANIVIKRCPARVANGARRIKGGCIAGNLPSHAMGAMYHGSKAIRAYAMGAR
jgi:hypothetical protein